MKLFFVVALNLALILGFFLFAQQKNRNLIRQLAETENSIKSKQNLQLAVRNFKSEQEQILLHNKNVADLEPLKTQTLDFMLNLSNELPAGISLVELIQSDGIFWVSGKADSEKALRSFIALRHLKLLKSKRLFFEASGNI